MDGKGCWRDNVVIERSEPAATANASARGSELPAAAFDPPRATHQ